MTDLFGRPIDPPAQQLELGMHGRVRQGIGPAPPAPWFCRHCNHHERLLCASGPDRCAQCLREVEP